MWSCLASFNLVSVLMLLQHLAYGEFTQTCKKQWFIVNHSEKSQRIKVKLYFQKSTSTLQFLSVLWERNCRWGWEQNLDHHLFYKTWGSDIYLHPHLVSAVLCVVNYGDSVTPQLGRSSGINCTLFSGVLCLKWVTLYTGCIGSALFCTVQAEFRFHGLRYICFSLNMHSTYPRKILMRICIRNISNNFLIENLPLSFPTCNFPQLDLKVWISHFNNSDGLFYHWKKKKRKQQQHVNCSSCLKSHLV